MSVLLTALSFVVLKIGDFLEKDKAKNAFVCIAQYIEQRKSSYYFPTSQTLDENICL